MPSLRDTQIGFTRALFSGVHGPGTPGVRSDGLSPALRLGFYRTNVTANYLDALRATYGAVERTVGSAHFRALAERFIRDWPSRSGDLNVYGEEFGTFLRGQAAVLDLPWLPDLAQLEWLVDGAFYAADYAPLSVERLAQVPSDQYENLVFRLHPACRLLRSDYPIRRIWEACQPGHAGDASVIPEQGAQSLLIRRERFDVLIEEVDAATFAMLRGLRSGLRFIQAFERASAVQSAFDPGSFLQAHVGNCTLVDFGLAAAPARDDESFSVP